MMRELEMIAELQLQGIEFQETHKKRLLEMMLIR
jgi:hypothetical protein